MAYPSFYSQGDTIGDVLDKLSTSAIIQSKDYKTVELPNSQTPNYSPIFRNKLSVNGLWTSLHPDISTFIDILEYKVNQIPNDPLINYLPTATSDYKSISYKESYDLINHLGSGILTIFSKNFHDLYQPINDFILTIYSSNSYKWVLTDLTTQLFSITNTALYESLGKESTNFILTKTKSPIVFLTKDKILKLLEIEDLPHLKILVSFDDLLDEDSHLYSAAKQRGLLLYDFQNLIKIGQLNPQPVIKPKSDTKLTISFTSGTSGIPKGVILTQANAITQNTLLNPTFYKRPNTKGKIFIFLPLAHILERSNVYLAITLGAELYFPHNSNDLKSYFNDLVKAKPTMFSGVPRIYNRLETAFKSKLNNDTLSGRLLQRAINYKLDNYEKTGFSNPAKHFIYDRLLAKVRAKIGFNDVTFLATGSAPLSHETSIFIRAILNIDTFHEGYGATETFGGLCLSRGTDLLADNIGQVGTTTEIKLEDVPEMQYTWSLNRSGELLVRGGQISPGYFEDDENNSKGFIDDWYKTGDIVKLDTNGRLKIIDRRKNFFKLSQGEYIAPEKIENVYLSENNDLISQIWCYGDGLQNYLIGIIGIDVELLTNYLKHEKIHIDLTNKDHALSILNSIGFKTNVLKRLNKNVHDQLQGFEKLQNIYIDFEPLKISNDTITPTLKVKRHTAKIVFKDTLTELYKQGSLIQRNKL